MDDQNTVTRPGSISLPERNLKIASEGQMSLTVVMALLAVYLNCASAPPGQQGLAL